MRVCEVIILGCIALAGCSSQQIHLTAGPGQEAIVRDGLPALVSQKKHLVMLRPNSRIIKGSARPAFTVVVRNQSSKAEDLLESSISASQSLAGKSVTVRVYRYDELVSEEQTRQAVAAFGSALSGMGRAMSAANAGYVTTSGSFNAYGSAGHSYGTYSATTHDPLRVQVAQQAANAETAADFARLRAQGEQNLQALQETILKDNTVLPGEWIGGSIVLDPPQKPDSGAANYTIVIEFAGEQHTFAVSQVES